MRSTTALTPFNRERRIRREAIQHFGGMDHAKAHPVAMQRFNPDEGGIVTTNLDVVLAPVAGHMRSKVYADVVQIFVPYQAIEKMQFDGNADSGVTEMTRRRLLEGTRVGNEPENVISQACYIHPKRNGPNLVVSQTVRLAYNCAVNHLRKLLHPDAIQLDKTSTGIQPATLTATVLDRFNGVLDPERNIDGAISLGGQAPLTGIGVSGAHGPVGTALRETEASSSRSTTGWVSDTASHGGIVVEMDPDNPGYPKIYANLDGPVLTLRDMMQAQRLDGLVRAFAQLVDQYPEKGEEMVSRALYNIGMDYDDECIVMYRKVHELSPAHHRPTDGASINSVSAHFTLSSSFNTLVPRSELGGQLVTLVMVKPLETLQEQPHPTQTEPWDLINRVHDETALDEVLITRRDLEADVSAAHADTPVFWTGHNQLKHEYETAGPNVQQTTSVAMQSSMWVYPVPSSVTPENVSYPATIDVYPFFNWSGPAAEYTISQTAMVSTHLAKGPNPVERIALFANDPTLIA